MDNIFESALQLTLSLEGYESNDVDDSGGYTKYGIAQNKHKDIDVKSLTLDDVRQIAYNDYWIRYKCDIISEINYKLAIMHFDTAYHTGSNSIRILQKAIRIQYPQITVDGIFGSQTEKYLVLCNQKMLLESYTLNRIRFYNELVANRPKDKKYLHGWINRAYIIYDYAVGG